MEANRCPCCERRRQLTHRCDACEQNVCAGCIHTAEPVCVDCWVNWKAQSWQPRRGK